MATDINLNVIDSALSDLARAAETIRYTARGADAYDRARWMEQNAREAQKELSKLSALWPRIRGMLADADRAYDAYVTSPRRDYGDDERTGCSCHLSAPCSFCTSQSDDDEDEAAPQSEASA
jgi:hypothetical protein